MDELSILVRKGDVNTLSSSESAACSINTHSSACIEGECDRPECHKRGAQRQVSFTSLEDKLGHKLHTDQYHASSD